MPRRTWTEELERVSTRVPIELLDWLDDISEECKISRARVIRSILEEAYVEAEGEPNA